MAQRRLGGRSEVRSLQPRRERREKREGEFQGGRRIERVGTVGEHRGAPHRRSGRRSRRRRRRLRLAQAQERQRARGQERGRPRFAVEARRPPAPRNRRRRARGGRGARIRPRGIRRRGHQAVRRGSGLRPGLPAEGLRCAPGARRRHSRNPSAAVGDESEDTRADRFGPRGDHGAGAGLPKPEEPLGAGRPALGRASNEGRRA